MKYSHSFHSLEAEKGPMSFTFGHTHPGIVGTKSPPRDPKYPPAKSLDLVEAIQAGSMCLCHTPIPPPPPPPLLRPRPSTQRPTDLQVVLTLSTRPSGRCQGQNHAPKPPPLHVKDPACERFRRPSLVACWVSYVR